MCSNSVAFGVLQHEELCIYLNSTKIFLWRKMFLASITLHEIGNFILLKVTFNVTENDFVFPSVKLKSFGTNECSYV